MKNQELILAFVIALVVLIIFFFYLKILIKLVDKRFTKEKIGKWKDKKVIFQYNSSTKSSVILTCIFFGGPVYYFAIRKSAAKRSLLLQSELIERNLLYELSGWELLNEKLSLKSKVSPKRY